MNKDSKIYSIPVKTVAVISSAILFAMGIGCMEIFFWLLDEGIYDMNAFEISNYLTLMEAYTGRGDYLSFIRFLVASRYLVVLVGFLTGIFYIANLTLVLTIAGYKRGVEGVQRNPINELPFDVLSFFYLIMFSIALEFIADAEEYTIIVDAILSISMYLIAYFIALGFAISLVVNIKAGTIFKNMLIVKVGKWIINLFGQAFCTSKAISKVFLYFGMIVIFELTVISTFRLFLNMGMLWFFSNIVIFLGILYIVGSINFLEEAGKKISEGEVEFRVDEKKLMGDFRIMARHLNRISAGLEHALNERMKSERFKTELITNVSHDIKTPLTSIINYTNLLKKENVENEQVSHYIEVLDRQSNRLKRLITDLIEASKASSGSLQVEFTEFDIGVMVSQAIGEYQDKLEKAGLSVVTKFMDSPCIIRADGRHLWRVIDNILNNICKYAKIDTRVYVDLCKREEKTIVTFKNISQAELNISGEELMERFVRGERARNTEGSGLGLSIAKSMMELMEAELRILVDGDLFKVELIF